MKNRGKLIKKKKNTIRRLFVRQILNVLRTGRYICPLIKIPVAVEFNKFELQIHASRVAFDFIGPVPAELFPAPHTRHPLYRARGNIDRRS